MTRTQEVRPTYVVDEPETAEPVTNIATRIVNLIGGIIIGLLALRFILSLFGANRNNGFADFIYGFSHPFVSPFFGLFNYTPQFGVVRFEFETLIAMLFYALAIVLVTAIINVGKRTDQQ